MTIESERDLAGMARAGRVVALALGAMRRQVTPGVTTRQLDAAGSRVFESFGAHSAPAHFYGFPGVNCISVNDEAVHGIPGGRRIQPGDLVKLDVTAKLDGYIADAAITVAVPPVTPEARQLIASAESAFRCALQAARPRAPLNEIGRAIEGEAHRCGFEVLRELNSHGVGRAIHEPPSIPQYFEPRLRGRLWEGLVITLEPILSCGSSRVRDSRDGWTIRTADGSLSAHHEHTIVVTRDGPVVLTAA